MRQNIYISETKRARKREKSKVSFGIYIIISFLATFFILWILEGSAFTSALRFVFSPKNIVSYDTFTVSFDDSVPEEYKDSIVENLEKLDFNGKKRFEIKDGNADIELSSSESDNSVEVYSKRLIPVGHEYSLLDSVESDGLTGYTIYILDGSYKSYLENEYGVQVSVAESYDSLVSILLEDDNNIALLDFGDIDYKVKILKVGSEYFLDNTEACIPISLFAELKNGVDEFAVSVLEKNIDTEGVVFDPEKLVKVNMSGVVAISRGLAIKIDKSGDYGYPAQEIGEFLSDADLTHVSNEVSFVEGCTSYSGMTFCAKPEYIEALQDSGVDIVELTGNHNNDYGSDNNTTTIETYTSLGMRYFGGGLNEEDASKILYEEVNGMTIAFVGYNYYDTIYQSLALAGEDRAGANSYSEEKVKTDVEEANENADIVIVTFQFQECYCYPDSDVIYSICYQPLSSPDQGEVFRNAVDYGADIVIGTQAHQPQTYELYGDGIIFYGLGNLYFDQSMWIGTRQGLILSHYFYEGKHIQTEITPIYTDTDLIPELATEEEGNLLMELLKEARE